MNVTFARDRRPVRVLLAATLAAAFASACAGGAPAAPPSAAAAAAAQPTAAAPAVPAGPVLDAGVYDAEARAFAGAALSAFAKESLPDFSTFRLSNGIPVVLKRNSANRVQHLSLLVFGGAAASSLATAGYEALALKTMARGSAAYGYREIQEILDETSSSIGSQSSLEYSAYSLNTLDKYFDALMPLWADCLVRPSFNEEDFDQVLSEAKLVLQSKEQNPWSKTGLVMNALFFAGHPYAANPEGTKESLAAATLDAAKAWYASRFSARNVAVVAVGDFDPPALRASLERGLGAVPAFDVARPPPVPAFPIGGGPGSLMKQDFPQSKGVGYVRGDFAAPGPDAPDFMALNLGMAMLSDLLFNVVRDKYGATYTPDSFIRTLGANYGSITINKTRVAGRVKSYIDEAVSTLASGRAMSVAPAASDGKEPRMPIDQALAVYKAQYVNELFFATQTNAAIAGRIAASIVQTGDFRTWLLDVDRINAVTAEQVSAALSKYLVGSRITWVVLGAQDVLMPVVDVDYEGFSLRR